MCFSATASFAASAGLSVIGIISVMRAHKNKNLLPFAAIPLLFAIQQAIEGIIWLSFTHESLAPYQSFAAYTFLFFASFLWPIWASFASYRMEPNAKRKEWLKKIIPFGTLVGCATFGTILIKGVNAEMLSCHIAYNVPFPSQLQLLGLVAYMFATMAPLLLSTVPLVPLLGLLIAVAYAVSFFFYYTSLGSVWCFFAALLSSIILLIVTKKR